MVTASTPGTVRSRSTSARCDCLPRASSYPARPGSTSTSNPPSRRNPGSAVATESCAHQEQSAAREQENRERNLADHQCIADLAASRPRASLVTNAPHEVRRGRAACQPPGRPCAEDQRGDQTERHCADENSPVEIERGEAQGDRDHETQGSQQRSGGPLRQAAVRQRLRRAREAILPSPVAERGASCCRRVMT